MIFDGLRFTRVSNAVFRHANENDRTLEGKPIPRNYCVFILVKNVDADPKDGEAFWTAVEKTQNIIPCKGHSLTNKMYGQPNVVKNSKPIHVFDNGVRKLTFSPYILETPVYLAYDGEVYKTTIRNESTEEAYLAQRKSKTESA